MGIYVHNIYIDLLKDLVKVYLLKEVSNLFLLKLRTPIKKNIIGVICRTPDINILDYFFEHMQRIFNNISSENKTSYIMVDFNINLVSNTDSSINSMNIISSFCFTHTPTILIYVHIYILACCRPVPISDIHSTAATERAGAGGPAAGRIGHPTADGAELS